MGLFSFLSQSRQAKSCGHTTKLKGRITAYGESVHLSLKCDGGSPEYCLDCIQKMSVRCAWCGGSIFVGDPVTLYTPQSAKDMERNFDKFRKRGQLEFAFVDDSELGYRLIEGSVIYKRKPLQLVGCLRMSCADSGADRAGFWVTGEGGQGRVKRVRSAFEEIVAGKSAVIVGDLADPSQATELKDKDVVLQIVRNI